MSTPLLPPETTSAHADCLISTAEFERRTGVKRSMRYLKWTQSKYHDPFFPKPIKVGKRSNRFSLHATIAWVNRVKAADISST